MRIFITLTTGTPALELDGAVTSAITVAAEFAEACASEFKAAADRGEHPKFAASIADIITYDVAEKGRGRVVGTVRDTDGRSVGSWIVEMD